MRAVKNQVMLSEFTNREKIDTLRLQLLDVALKASDWLVPVKTRSLTSSFVVITRKANKVKFSNRDPHEKEKALCGRLPQR